MGLGQPGLAGSAQVGKAEDRSLCPCYQKHEHSITIFFGDRSLRGNSALGVGVVGAQSQKLELQNQDRPHSSSLGSIRAVSWSAEPTGFG